MLYSFLQEDYRLDFLINTLKKWKNYKSIAFRNHGICRFKYYDGKKLDLTIDQIQRKILELKKEIKAYETI